MEKFLEWLKKILGHIGLWLAEFIIHYVIDEILDYIDIYHGNYCIVKDKIKDKENENNDK